MLTKQELLEQIRADIINNNVCPDLAKMATNLVMGEGSVDADILFVGEAPGKNEDLLGRPFIGAAGKLLDKMLQGIDLQRQDVYITNIVKYRPPKNRDPSAVEKAEFWPYLVRQIDILQPKLIVTLGRHSMSHFLPQCIIGQVHGTLQEADGLAVLPLYHPAAALYNGGLRQTLIDDFNRIPKILIEITKKG